MVGNFVDDPEIFITSLSAYDIARNIYYTSQRLTLPPYSGVSYINVNTSEEDGIFSTKTKYNSYTWFVKQFVR